MMELRSGHHHGSYAIQARCEQAKAMYGKANQDRIRVKPSATGQGIHILFDRERSLVSWDRDGNNGPSSSDKPSTRSSTRLSTASSIASSTTSSTRSSAKLSGKSSKSSGKAPQTPRNQSPYQPVSVLRTPQKLKRQERIGGSPGLTGPALSSSLVSDSTVVYADAGQSPLSAMGLPSSAQGRATATDARHARATRALEAGRGRISTTPDISIKDEYMSDVVSRGSYAPTETGSFDHHAPAQVKDRRHLPAGHTATTAADMNLEGRVVSQRMEKTGPSGTVMLDELGDRREWDDTQYVVNAGGKMHTIPETFE